MNENSKKKMKLDHIIFKVDNLDKAVKEYRENGFEVEYGKLKNPYNAIIYFAQGPYLELLERTGMPSVAKKLLSFFGKRAFVSRLNTWDKSKEGLIGLGISNQYFHLDREIEILKRYNKKYFSLKPTRIDTKNRELKFTGLFPDDMEIPILSTKLSVNVRPPKDYVHPNGVKFIKGVSFGTKEEFFPIISELCDDEGLKLFIGDGVKDLEFEYQR